jgi:ubiquinone/menaquinone biosynthesis C-methylase UbiE
VSKIPKHAPHTKADRRIFFNEAANNWDIQFSNTVTANFLEMLMSRLELASGQKVLDVGTGTGIFIPSIVKAVGQSGLVVAVDFAEKMVEICKRKYSGLPNVKVELRDIEVLDYPSNYFDAITCFGVFPHIQNKQKVLFKMNLVLKRYGKLLIAHALSSNEIRELHRNESPIIADDVIPGKKEMTQLLNNAGFEIDCFEDQPGRYICVSIKR